MSTSYPPDPPNLEVLHIDDDVEMGEKEKDPREAVAFQKLKTYAKNLPYSIESNSKMQKLLDFYLMRIVQVCQSLLFGLDCINSL